MKAERTLRACLYPLSIAVFLVCVSIGASSRLGATGSLYPDVFTRLLGRERGSLSQQPSHDPQLGHTYMSCPDVANGTSLFRVDSVHLDPERIARGSTATFRISVAAEDEVELQTMNDSVGVFESGRVRMLVKYGGVQVYHEEDRICDLVESCPLPRRGELFDVVYVKEFPLITPPGAYEVEIRGEMDNGSPDAIEAMELLFCVRVGFRVAFW